MGKLGRRVDRLEQGRKASAAEPSEESRRIAREFWKMEVEDVALKLVCGDEPDLSADDAGNFYTPEGKFAVGPEQVRLDVRIRHLDAMILQCEERGDPVPEDRWERFLARDEEAADLLDELKALSRAVTVLEGYRTGLELWQGSLAEAPPEVLEEARPLAWALIHNPEAIRLLSELTRRRDVFVGEAAGQE